MNPTLNQCASGTPGSSNQELFAQNFNGLVMGIGNGQVDGLVNEPEIAQTLHCMHDQQAVLYVDEVCETLDASYYKGVGGRMNKERQIVCVNGAETPICNSEKANPCKCTNNGLENVVCYHWHSQALTVKKIEDECSPTIPAAMGMGGANMTTPMLIHKQKTSDVICYENHANDSRITESNEISPVISSRAGTGGGNLPLVQECIGYYPSQHHAPKPCETPTLTTDNCAGIRGDSPLIQECYAIDSVASNSMKSGNPHSGFHKEDIAKTLDTTSPDPTKNQGGNIIVESTFFEPGIAKREGGDSRFVEECCGTLRSNAGDNQAAVAIAENIIGRKVENGGNGTGAQEELAYTQNASGVMGVANHATVRRLLPIECERLMGFPTVNVLEIGKMTKDEFIAWELAQGNISVDIESGKVFSHRTGGGTPCAPRELEGTIINGYKVVSLREKSIKKQCRVHRIIWIVANGIIPKDMTIDHINNNKLDNRISNLQLLSAVDNSLKAHADGLIPHKSKLSQTEVLEMVTLYEDHNIPLRKLASMFGISKSRVQQLIKTCGWTQIPWKGKPAEECPDSPRYKACGNSMCVNVMRWIGMRIELTERKANRIKNKDKNK